MGQRIISYSSLWGSGLLLYILHDINHSRV